MNAHVTKYQGQSFTGRGWVNVELYHVEPCNAHPGNSLGCLRMSSICYPVSHLAVDSHLPQHYGCLRAVRKLEDVA